MLREFVPVTRHPQRELRKAFSGFPTSFGSSCLSVGFLFKGAQHRAECSQFLVCFSTRLRLTFFSHTHDFPGGRCRGTPAVGESPLRGLHCWGKKRKKQDYSMEFVDLVKSFPTVIWSQKSAPIPSVTSDSTPRHVSFLKITSDSTPRHTRRERAGNEKSGAHNTVNLTVWHQTMVFLWKSVER